VAASASAVAMERVGGGAPTSEIPRLKSSSSSRKAAATLKATNTSNVLGWHSRKGAARNGAAGFRSRVACNRKRGS